MPSVALCIIFKVKLIIKEKQFTVHMVGYPEESIVLRSDNYEEFYCKGLFSGNIKLFETDCPRQGQEQVYSNAFK